MQLQQQVIPATRPALSACERFWRAANYMTAVILYLQENVLLREKLLPSHLKRKFTGHWGTCPGINFVYAHLSAFVKETGQRSLLVLGPGHAGPALLSCLLLEGTLERYYPALTRDARGLRALARAFGMPKGFQTELAAHYPGTLFAGGELGPALAMAQGAALDNPGLLVAVVIGDGEAETGSSQAALLGGRYVRANYAGTVLPIVHLNGLRMGGRSLLDSFSHTELVNYFSGMGYMPYFADHSHVSMQLALQNAWRHSQDTDCSPAGPLIVLRTKKGWSAPSLLGAKPVEGGLASHKVPPVDVHSEGELEELEQWLRSYDPESLFTESGEPEPEIFQVLPPRPLLLSSTLEALHQSRKKPLLPEPSRLERPTQAIASPLEDLAGYFSQVAAKNARGFRVFSPDELSSNRLDRLIADGAGGSCVLEILSEHVCEGWLQGYVLSGRPGVFVTYEAFSPIVSSMITQYLKFLLEAGELPWRPELPALNLLLTSLGLRNTFTHQNPDLVATLLAKRLDHLRIYYPIDANALLAAGEIMLTGTNVVNVIVANKYPSRVWGSVEIGSAFLREGFSVFRESAAGPPDVVLCAIGDWALAECVAAEEILHKMLPGLRIRIAVVSELSSLGSAEHFAHSPGEEEFIRCFTADKPVIVCCGSHAAPVEALLFGRTNPTRFQVLGFRDRGGNHTEVSMLIDQGLDRFSLSRKAALAAADAVHAPPEGSCRSLLEFTAGVQERHAQYVLAHGADPEAGWAGWSLPDD